MVQELQVVIFAIERILGLRSIKSQMRDVTDVSLWNALVMCRNSIRILVWENQTVLVLVQGASFLLNKLLLLIRLLTLVDVVLVDNLTESALIHQCGNLPVFIIMVQVYGSRSSSISPIVSDSAHTASHF